MKNLFPYVALRPVVALLIVASVIVCMSTLSLAQQGTLQDVVYLKDGSVIRGIIIEQKPGKTIKLPTADGNIFVYKMDLIDKIEKEKTVHTETTVQTEAPSHATTTGPATKVRAQGSFLFGGAIYSGFYLGTGVRFGANIPPGIYVGGVVVNHFVSGTDISISYIGGEIGFGADLQTVSITPYMSFGVGFGGGQSAFYVAPAFAITAWITPDIGFGPDLRYAYLPDYSTGFGGIYMALTYRF